MSKESGRFEPVETLLPEDVTVGSIVLYVSGRSKHQVWPAIVNSIVSMGVVNLHVFSDEGPQAVMREYGVKYSLTDEPCTWRWEL